jgi:rhamnulokinase
VAQRTMASVDLGAESGRVMLARFDGQRLELQEVHRFPNRAIRVRSHRFWDMLALWDETLTGLRKARQLAGTLESVGIDTWGIDYGLVDVHGLLLGQPYQYRDQRTEGVMEQVCTRVPREQIYERTGIQFLSINTLFQLYAHERMHPGQLAQAHRLLMIPDLLHSWLCGELVCERTNASTTQCWNPVAGAWATELLQMLDLPTEMLPPVVEPGTPLGRVLPEWRDELGDVQVIAPATHDTGSAIAAIPVASPDGWGYISSGTWSLVGVELSRPVITAEALNDNYTNEGGVFGTTRFLKNVMGLWLLQECMRSWAKAGHPMDYETLLADVDSVPAFTALIDPDAPCFLAPPDMPTTINTYLSEHHQPTLQTPATFARCIMESLVLRYCQVLNRISRFTARPVTGVYVVGGGARNARLNQWLADALGVPVIAGPFEATALGNALMQLVGLGELHTLAEVRAIAQCVPTQIYEPDRTHFAAWQEKFALLFP